MALREAGLAEARRADMLRSTAADAGGMLAFVRSFRAYTSRAEVYRSGRSRWLMPSQRRRSFSKVTTQCGDDSSEVWCG